MSAIPSRLRCFKRIPVAQFAINQLASNIKRQNPDSVTGRSSPPPVHLRSALIVFSQRILAAEIQMHSNENRICEKSKENKPTGVSLPRTPPPALDRPAAARRPYLHDFKLYISEIPICRAPTLRYEMKQNKSGTTRCARKKSKPKLKIKAFSSDRGRMQCLRPSSNAGRNKNMRLFYI